MSIILGSLFTIIEFASFSLFFLVVINNSVLKKIVPFIIFLFSAFCITNIFTQIIKYKNLDVIPVTFQAIFIMTLCVIYFFEQIKTPSALFIYSTFEFWIVTGILVYLAGTFFIYIYSDKLTEKELDSYWAINYIFNALKNFIFGIGIYILGRKNRKQTEEPGFSYYSILENP